MAEKGSVGEGAMVETPEQKDVRKVCSDVLEGIKNFDVEVAKTAPWEDFQTMIKSNPALNAEKYTILSEDPYLGKDENKRQRFVGHDLHNLAGVMFAYQNLAIREVGNQKSQENIRRGLLKNWPRYSLILQDICLPGISRETVPEEYLGDFDSKATRSTLNLLVEGLEHKSKIKKETNRSYTHKRLDSDPVQHLVTEEGSKVYISVDLQRLEIIGEEVLLLNENEKTSVSTGVIINAISNITRNAVGEFPRLDEFGEQMYGEDGLPLERGAKNVILKISRETGESGEELVFRVIDDGKGMSAEYLNPQDENYIFQEGESHRSSSGLGLTNMPERMASMGVKLNVWTRERDTSERKRSFFSNEFVGDDREDNKSIKQKEGLAKIQKDIKSLEDELHFTPSTVFEIRIPITKLNNLEVD